MSLAIKLDKLRKEIVGEARDRVAKGDGRGPDELDVGPRGHARQRDYEARRPGDASDVTGEV
jgi:hypothetical protein